MQSSFLNTAANRYGGNLSYAGAYNTAANPSLMNALSQIIQRADSGFYNQPGISNNDTQQTTRYGEKSIQIPTSFFTI